MKVYIVEEWWAYEGRCILKVFQYEFEAKQFLQTLEEEKPSTDNHSYECTSYKVE